MEWIENLEPILKMFWYIAIPTSVVFILQTIMTFIGIGDTDAVDLDVESSFDTDAADFQLLTLRNLINFLLGFSWSGISLYGTLSNMFVLIVVSVIIGASFIYIFWLIMKQLYKFSEDNSFKMDEALYKNADVYLSIPGRMSGKGKILINVKGSTRELEAMTESEKIETGATVNVISINNNILIVEKV